MFPNPSNLSGQPAADFAKKFGRVYSPAQTPSQLAAPAAVPANTGTFTNISQPQPIYTPTQTQQGVNQAVAHAQRFADPRWAQKQFLTPGRSADAGTMSAAIPAIGDALTQARLAQAQIPLSDYIANQQNLLAGQVGQDTESLGLSNLLSRMQGDQFNNNLSWWNTLTSPLMQMMLGSLQ